MSTAPKASMQPAVVEANGANPDATLEQCKQAASEMADTPAPNDQEGA
jgi:hypothetical protein